MEYSEFLKPFKRVYHLVGVKEDCELVKNNYDLGVDDKLFEFIIKQEPSFEAPKQEKSSASSPGILKCEWLNKVLATEPMLTILVFNASKPFETQDTWEDRLKPISIQIAKAKENIKWDQKKKMAVAILIITPNGSPVPLDKVKEIVKVSDRSLQVVELQSLKNEMKRIKNTWYNTWKSCLQERIKEKQDEKGLKDETRLRGMIKLAVLYEISSSDETIHYDKAHAFCKQIYKGMDNIKEDDIPSTITRLELRFIGDVLFLKAFRSWYKTNPLESLGKFKAHYNEFRSRSLDSIRIYPYYEELYWRSQFLTELVNYILGVGISNSSVESRVHQLVKGIIAYNIELSKIDQSVKLEKTSLQQLPSEYFGRINYKITNQATFVNDFKNSRLSYFVYRSQEFLQQGLLLISQLKDLKRIKGEDDKRLRPHEETFYSISECRIYINQNNLEKAVKIYNSMVDSFLKKNDFLVLNCLLKEFQPLLEKNQHHAELAQFYLVAIKILDYFKSLEHLPQFVRQLISISGELQSPITHHLGKGSCLIDMKVDYQTITCLLSDKIKINIKLNINPEVSKLFQKMVIKFKKNIADVTELALKEEQTIEIEPSDYLTEEDILQIDEVELRGHKMIWIIKGENITYAKKNRVHIIMPMADPIIKITEFYKKCYSHQAIPLEIQIINNNPDTKVLSKVLFKEQKTEPPGECFLNTQQSLNHINTETPIKLSENTPHMFYLKFPADGERKLTILFKTEMTKTYYNSKGEKKEVNKPPKKYQEERKFVLEPMLTVSKRLTIPSNEYLTKKIELKEGVYRIPSNQNVMIQYFITAEDNIILTGIRQEELDQNVKFIRRLNMKDIELQPRVSLKVFSIIKVLNAKELSNLPSLRIDWRRKTETIINSFIDIEQKLSTKEKVLSIQFKQADVSKKWEVGTVHYRVNNHSNKKIRVRVEAMETESVLIVGKNKTDIVMTEQSHVILAFKILPLVVGEILLPQLLIRADQKLEAKLEKRHIAFVL